MTALIVIGVIALVIAGILFIRATVYIDYRDEVKLSVSVAGIKIGIMPKKEKKVNIKKYSPKKFRKMLEKKKKQEQKKLLKKQKNDEKKKAKKLAKKEAKKKEAAQSAPKKQKRSLLENIELIKNIVSIFFSRFGKHFRIKVARLNLTVATGDAAQTAIMYGVAVQAVEYILEILDRVTNVKYKKDAEVNVNIDYLSDKPTVDISLAFGLRVWHLFDILFRVAFGFISQLVKSKNKNI